MGLPVRPGLVCDSGQGVPVNRAGLVIDADGVEACLFGGLRRLKGVLENRDLGGSGVQTPGSLKKYVGVVLACAHLVAGQKKVEIGEQVKSGQADLHQMPGRGGDNAHPGSLVLERSEIFHHAGLELHIPLIMALHHVHHLGPGLLRCVRQAAVLNEDLCRLDEGQGFGLFQDPVQSRGVRCAVADEKIPFQSLPVPHGVHQCAVHVKNTIFQLHIAFQFLLHPAVFIFNLFSQNAL